MLDRRALFFRVLPGILPVFQCLVFAEQTHTNPARITVTATRISAEPIALNLDSEPGVLINSQGGPGIQSDLSIRGSSFSGAGLSLSGLALKNPQTEHFHAELPLPSVILTKPEILTGIRQTIGADGHLVGTVSLDFLPVFKEQRIDLGVGERGRDWQSLLYQLPLTADEGSGRVSLGVFAGREKAEGVDYRDNDLDRLSGGVHIQALTDKSQTDVVAARQWKEFGARGYYGVSPDLFAEEEMDDTLVLARSQWQSADGSYVRMSAVWRAIEDDYRLYWTLPGIYANHHLSTFSAVTADGKSAVLNGAVVSWRVGAEGERLDSSRLGNHRRKRGVLLLLPQWSFNGIRVDAGARGEVFTDESPAVLPQAGLDVEIAENSSVYCSYTESVRRPSFTELNYDSPGSLGRQGLKRQQARSFEAGWRWESPRSMDWQLALFHRRSKNTVDWIKELSTSPRWVATDLGTVDTRGAELAVRYVPAGRFRIIAAYTWLDKVHDTELYASRYVLDYPRHLAQLSAVWRVNGSCEIVAAQALRRQTANPIRTSDRSATNGRLALHMTPGRLDGIKLTFLVDNIWNNHFEVFAGQPVAGRRFSAALTIGW